MEDLKIVSTLIKETKVFVGLVEGEMVVREDVWNEGADSSLKKEKVVPLVRTILKNEQGKMYIMTSYVDEELKQYDNIMEI